MKSRVLPIVFVAIALMVLVSCQQPPTTFSSTEIVVGIGITNQSMPAFGTRYYRFNAAGDGVHTISLTNLSSDMDWYLVVNNSLTNNTILATGDANFDSSDEIGPTSSISLGTTYYIIIEEWDNVAGNFDLEVTFP